MADTDCDDLKARADMLHQEAELGRRKAEGLGRDWESYKEQVEIADRCDVMAVKVEAAIAADC